MKTILVTGSTDGIGLETAKALVSMGHDVLLHGRNASKLEVVRKELNAEGYVADLSRLQDVEALAAAIAGEHLKLDVLINNAGVLKAPNPIAVDGQDVRFVVNTIAPYLLTKRLLPLIGKEGRVVNLSSAAQAPVSLDALAGRTQIRDDFHAYAQSKLAITMWSYHLSLSLPGGPMIVSVNPGSLLGTKMVKDGFGMEGKDVRIGADILVRAALSDEFADASGQYYDNDSSRFAAPHPDALDEQKCEQLVQALEELLTKP